VRKTLTVTAAAVAFMFLIGPDVGSQGQKQLDMPQYHHIHIDSTYPDKSLDWYEKYWPAASLERRRAFLPQLEAYQAALKAKRR